MQSAVGCCTYRRVSPSVMTSYAMARVLPLSVQMTDKLVQFGYVTVEFTEDCLLGRKGTVVRGHSFHYSRDRVTGQDKNELPRAIFHVGQRGARRIPPA